MFPLNDKPYLTFPIPSLFLPLHSKMLNNHFFRPSPQNCHSLQLSSFFEQLEVFSKAERNSSIKPLFHHQLTTEISQYLWGAVLLGALAQSVPLTKQYMWWKQPKITSQKITIFSTEDRSGVFNSRTESNLSSGLLTVHPAKLAVPSIIKLWCAHQYLPRECLAWLWE